MELQRLTSLKDIKIGDIFTMITSDFEDNIIQFIGRNPMIKDEGFSKKSGYFVEVYGKKEVFIIEEKDLAKEDYDFYIGYDAEFILERRIERITNHYNYLLTSLQDQLIKLKEHNAKKP